MVMHMTVLIIIIVIDVRRQRSLYKKSAINMPLLMSVA